MNGTPASRAIAAMAAMSITFDRGLPSVSEKIALVLGLSALRKFSGSSGSTQRGVDAELPEVHVEHRVRPAVHLGGGHDMIAALRNIEEGDHLGRLTDAVATAARPFSIAATRSSNTAVGGIRQPRIDVAERLEVEEARGVVRAVEHVRRRLVERHGARARFARPVSGLRVQAQRLEAEFSICHVLVLAE